MSASTQGYFLFALSKPKPTLLSPAAPILSIIFEGDGSHLPRNGDFAVIARVNYERLAGATEDAKLIIFHISNFDNAYRLYRFRDGK